MTTFKEASGLILKAASRFEKYASYLDFPDGTMGTRQELNRKGVVSAAVSKLKNLLKADSSKHGYNYHLMAHFKVVPRGGRFVTELFEWWVLSGDRTHRTDRDSEYFDKDLEGKLNAGGNRKEKAVIANLYNRHLPSKVETGGFRLEEEEMKPYENEITVQKNIFYEKQEPEDPCGGITPEPGFKVVYDKARNICQEVPIK